MIQIDMDMPKNCLECDFYANGDSNFLWYGVKLGGKCKRLPIKDMDGDVVGYQVVCKNGRQAGELRSGKRYKYCPLKECK